MKKLANFLICSAFLLGSSFSVLAQAGGSPYDPNELLIKFASGTPRAVINGLLADYGAVEVAISPVSEVRLWFIDTFPAPGPIPFSNINEVVGNSNSQPEVSGAGLNYETTLVAPPGFGAAAGVWDANGVCGYTLATQSNTQAVKVVIMDTGVNYNCPQLAGRFLPGAPGHDFVNNDPFPLDDHGHGTHIAGLIDKVARLSGDPDIRFFSYKTHDDTGKGELFNVILAVDAAVLASAHIINMSFSYRAPNGLPDGPMGAFNPPAGQPSTGPGGPNNGKKVAPLEAAIDLAGKKGILVLAAAGNHAENNDLAAFPCFPASFPCPNILAVASGDCQKQRSTFSNWGPTRVDIVAPGESMEATGINCANQTKSGTSQATAVVSAVAAVLGTHFNALPFHYERVKCAILQGAEVAPNLLHLVLTSGVIHAPNALVVFQNNGCDPQQPSTRPLQGAQVSKGGLMLAPNPFSTALRVQFELGYPEVAEMDIWDIQGKQVFAQQLALEQGQQEMVWTPEGVGAGIYQVRIRTSGKMYSAKAVLLR